MAPCRPRRLVCTGTEFYYTSLPGTCARRGADYYLKSLCNNCDAQRRPARPVTSVLEYQTGPYMFGYHGTSDGSVELFKHVMNMITSHPSALESPSRDSAL